MAGQCYLYKAITKSIFLTQREIVFDPSTDLIKYKGFTKPLCNLVVVSPSNAAGQQQQQTHLFVHKECVYDNTLQRALAPLLNNATDNDGDDNMPSGRTTAQGKPARDKAADEDEQYFF